MKLKFLLLLTFIGIGLFFVSCDKETGFTDTLTTDSETIDLNKINIPRFNTAKEFKNTLEKVKNLEGQEYLDWENQYGTKTIYGDYTRAKMEMDTITTWNSYLNFREKWKGIVKFPPIEKKTVNCYPLKLGEISWLYSKFLNRKLIYKIEKKNYFIFKQHVIIIDDDVKNINEELLNKIALSDKKINNIRYIKLPLKYDINQIKYRNSNVLPAYKTCSDFYDPAGYWCRERKMEAALSDIWLHFWIESSKLNVTLYQEYWADFYRRSDLLGWYHNDVDVLGMSGAIDGWMKITEHYPGGSWDWDTYFLLGVHWNGVDDDKMFSFDQNYFIFDIRYDDSDFEFEFDFAGGQASDMIDYYGNEGVCDETVHLECSIDYP